MDESRARLKAWIDGWTEVGAFLDAERYARVREADTAASIRALDSLFDSAVFLHSPKPTSGLVEFYEILGRSLRR
jgi:hypothetical protein